MEIKCSTIDQFCAELKHDMTHVFDDVVRVRVDLTAEQDEAITFEVALQATVIISKDTAEWLLSFSGLAGIDDYEQEEPVLEGSEVAAVWKAQVAKLLRRTGVRLGEGKIEL